MVVNIPKNLTSSELSNGYKIRRAAIDLNVPLAFSKCESEHRYKNFDMAAYTLQHPNHPWRFQECL